MPEFSSEKAETDFHGMEVTATFFPRSPCGSITIIRRSVNTNASRSPLNFHLHLLPFCQESGILFAGGANLNGFPDKHVIKEFLFFVRHLVAGSSLVVVGRAAGVATDATRDPPDRSMFSKEAPQELRFGQCPDDEQYDSEASQGSCVSATTHPV